MKPLTFACLVAVGALPTLAQTSGGVSQDFASLVPQDAVLFVRLSAVEELLPAVERVRSVVQPGGKPWTARDVLSLLEIPGDASLIDVEAPLGFALAVSRQKPIPVFILGTVDPVGFVESLQPPWREKARISGDCVGVALEGDPAAQEGPRGVLRDLPKGLIVARIDVRHLIEAFRPLIDLGLMQAESMLDSPQGAAPFDVRNFMQSFFDLAVDFLDSAERLDAVVTVDGSRMKLSTLLSTLEGSALSRWGRAEEVDYAALARRLDPDAAVQFASTFDTSGYTARVLDLYESMLDYAGEQGAWPPAIEVGDAAIEALRESQCHLGTTALTSFDVGRSGIRAAFLYSSPDTRALLGGLDGLLELPILARLGVRTGEPVELDLAGTRVVRRTTTFDLDALVQVLPESDRPPPEEVEVIGKALETLMPGGLQFAQASQASESGAGWALFVFGGDQAFLERSVERLSGAPPADRAWEPVVSALAGSNPGAFFRYDFARLTRGFAEILAMLSLGDTAEEAAAEVQRLEGRSLDLRGWAGIDGRTWKAGVVLDLEEIARYVQSLGG